MENILYQRISSVAVPMFDEHHRRIADGVLLLNRCILMSHYEDKEKTYENFTKIFSLIKDYLFVHFTCEEAFMEFIAFPDLENHKKRHKNFTLEMMRIRETVRMDDLSQIADMAWFLFSWLIGHINVEDIQYRKFFKVPELIDFIDTYKGKTQLVKPDFSRTRMLLDLIGI